MSSRYALFSTVLLGLVAAASPVTEHRGYSIPLRDRPTLITPEGVFDHDRAVMLAVQTKNKHRQNLINLARNNRAAFPEVH